MALIIFIIAGSLALLAYCMTLLTRPAAGDTRPRHSLSATPSPYRPRPWDEITADIPTIPGPDGARQPEEPIEYDPLDHRVPLHLVDQHLAEMGFADWYRPLELEAA